MDSFFEGVSITIHKGLFISFTSMISFAWVVGYFNFNILVALLATPFLLYWTHLVTEQYVNKKVEEIEFENFLQPDYESAEWLNLVIVQLWKLYPNSISRVIIDTLEPSLQISKPFFVRDVTIQGMSPGDKPPKVRKVKTCKKVLHKKDNLVNAEPAERDIVIDVKFKSSLDLQINLAIYLFGMNTPVPFLISDIFLDCWIRLTVRLDPNGNKLFEFIKISAINEPKLFVGVQPLTALKNAKKNGAKKFKIVYIPDLMQIPLLREWLNITFVTELKRSIRFPNSIDIYQTDLTIFTRKDEENGIVSTKKHHVPSASTPALGESNDKKPIIPAKEIATMSERIKRNSTNPHSKFTDKVVDSISKVREAVTNEFENLVSDNSSSKKLEASKPKMIASEQGKKSQTPLSADFLSRRGSHTNTGTTPKRSNPFSSKMKGGNHNEV